MSRLDAARFRAILGHRSLTVAASIRAARVSKRFPDGTESQGHHTSALSPRGSPVPHRWKAYDV